MLLARPLFFVHIPKTGGTSLRSLLYTRFDAAKALHIEGSEAMQIELAERLSSYRFVTGHVGFELSSRFQRAPVVITMLRDPVARSLSAFRYLRSLEPDAMVRDALRREVRRARELDLLDYLESDPLAAAHHLGNVQTWHLARGGVRRHGVEALSRADLERARRNLRRCASVGVTERFAESVAALCAALEWPPFPAVPHANESRPESSSGELDANAARALAELTELDSELYRTAVEELDGALAAAANAGRGQGQPSKRPPSALPGAGPVELSFERAIPGGGWHGRELIDDRWVSWTGPGLDSWLDLPLPPGSAVALRFRVVHALSSRQLQGLEVFADGEPLALTQRQDDGGRVFTAALAARAAASSSCRLLFRVPETLRPRDVVAGSDDSRRLGIAIDSVALVATAPLSLRGRR